MPKKLNLSKYRWIDASPPPNRDIRKLYSEFPTESDVERERQTRISILKRGKSRTSVELADELGVAKEHQVAAVGCCPVLVRQFRIWFVSAALAIHTRTQRKGVPFTLLDVNEAVDARNLGRLDWRRLHAKLRKRLARFLGDDVVVVGIGEVEYDPSRNKWQPHYHLMIYGAEPKQMKKLREKHYRAKRTGPRPMVRSAEGVPANWFCYMSKLIAFAKVATHSDPSRRVRLPDRQSREYFRYLANHRPTSFVFCLNCSIVDQNVVLENDVDEPLVTPRVRRPAPLRPLPV